MNGLIKWNFKGKAGLLCNQLAQPLEHDATRCKSNGFGRIGRKPGGNLVSIHKRQNTEGFFEQKGRGS
jgi:hypothetical protein